MARTPRIDLAGVVQHMIQRGNDRQPCFFRDIDQQRYLQELREITLARGCHVHAYVPMTNLVHLLITPTSNQWSDAVIGPALCALHQGRLLPHRHLRK